MIGAHGVGRRSGERGVGEERRSLGWPNHYNRRAGRGSSDRTGIRQRNGKGGLDHGGSGGRGGDGHGTAWGRAGSRLMERRRALKPSGAARDTRGGRAIT